MTNVIQYLAANLPFVKYLPVHKKVVLSSQNPIITSVSILKVSVFMWGHFLWALPVNWDIWCWCQLPVVYVVGVTTHWSSVTQWSPLFLMMPGPGAWSPHHCPCPLSHNEPDDQPTKIRTVENKKFLYLLEARCKSCEWQ